LVYYTGANRLDHSAQDENKEKERLDSAYLALKDLNISIRPGEKVAICGRSGR
jgi:ABC-type multidrug transport system fused ATPase/permease subunit